MEHTKLSLARRLKLQQLAIFEKVVESGSILAASRELHMTQPAVSKSIHELEGHFGEALFSRGKRGVKLTEFGLLMERHERDVLTQDAADPPLEHVPLFEETLCAVVARHHPLAAQPAIAVKDLKDLDWIVPTPESAARRSAKLFFDAIGIAMPRRIVESVSILTNVGLLLESPMVGLMPRTAAEQFVRAGLLAVLPLGAASPFGEVGYTLRADRPPTAATQRLLQALREAA